MNRLKKSMVVMLLSGTIVLGPRLPPAMEVQMFDAMANQDQREYLKFLVERAQKVLIEQDRRDLATEVRELFHEIRHGDHRSLGEAQFEEHLAIARDFIAEIAKKQLPFGRPSVESALIVTLNKNGIGTSPEFSRSLGQSVREKPFWPKLPLRNHST